LKHLFIKDNARNLVLSSPVIRLFSDWEVAPET
jgi:hypothetical protein